MDRAEATDRLQDDPWMLLDRTQTGVLVFDADDLRVLQANGWAVSHFELPTELHETRLADMFVGMSEAHAHALLRRLRQGLIDHLMIETSRRTADGSLKPVELRFTFSEQPGPRYVAIALDTSERSMPDELVVRRERLRDAMAEILRVLNRIDDRDELYREACRIAVERGGFRMAWIGLVNETTGDIVPVASAGDSIGYVDQLRLNVRKDARGPGMTVTAILTGQPVAIADPSVDPMFTTLKDEARTRGFQSAVSLPLLVEGRCIGALTVYGTVVNSFGAIEVELLQHLADDIAFKLEVIKREERRRAAEADRDRLAAVVEQAGESVVITDSEARVVYTNPAFSRLLGYSSEEVVGRQIDSLPGSAQAIENAAALAAEIRAGGTWTGSTRGVRKDGQRIDLHLSTSPRFNEWGAVIGSIIIGLDVSREKSLEAQLMQAQKMDAIGRLAGGVAHDFNNLLTAISGYAEMLEMELGRDDERIQDVAEIQHAAARATQLTRQLLAFSRRQVLTPRPLDPRAVITEVEPMLRRLLGEDVELAVSVPAGIGPIMVDQNQLDQVLVNLALNARDAMPGGGRLTIHARQTTLDGEFAAAHLGTRPGPYVVMTITDTGMGMTPEVLRNAFEPFFSTKGPGKGSGLGLSTVLGIVEQSNGYVDVESEPGKGAIFRIYLPKVAPDQAKEPGRAVRASTADATGTVLVVEDQGPVRALATRILQVAGYRVIEAASGEEALAVEASHSGPIDLLFTDVVLPGMSGHRVADALKARRPEMPVLYASGYDQEMIEARSGGGEPGVGYLPKPYRPEELLSRIRELLGSVREGAGEGPGAGERPSDPPAGA